MADFTALVLQATATIEGATKELISADGILSSDVPVTEQYAEEVRDWLQVADTSIMIASRIPEPKQDSKGVIETHKSAVDAYLDVAKEVRKKLYQQALNEVTVIDLVDHPMDMPGATAPPPSYDLATGGPGVTAPLIPEPKEPKNPRQQHVGSVRAKKPKKQLIIAVKKWRWTPWRIFLFAAIILLNIFLICVLVNHGNDCKKDTPRVTMSPEEFSRMHNDEVLTRFLQTVNEKIKHEKMHKNPAPEPWEYDDDGVPVSGDITPI